MKFLLCHNYYQQPGGEDQSFAAEARLLESRGHDVVRLTRHNDAIEQMSGLGVAARTLWNRQVYAEVRALIRRERPHLMHCTNTFPLISPAVYYAARAEGVPVVQSLRNYRLLCPNAQFLRDGRVCEDCLGRSVPWPGVLHGCYRGCGASAVVAALNAGHRLLGTWTRAVDHYFTLTEFARRKFIEGGLSADRIAVKPNFIDPDPGLGRGQGGYAVFVGRLSTEKGVETLLAAWRQLRRPVPLKVIGDGPLAELVQAAARADQRIEWLGRRSPDDILQQVGEAACLVMPSIWYETFGRTIIEAYSRGTPVVASRLGALAELVEDGRTGLLFRPGDAADLAAAVERVLAEPAGMRQAARSEYEAKYTAAINYRQLMAIYVRAMERSARGRAARAHPSTSRTDRSPEQCNPLCVARLFGQPATAPLPSQGAFLPAGLPPGEIEEA
jgi:glycosyltransferase involved in cell wall biosynthesis